MMSRSHPTTPPQPWTPATSLAFRFTFVYLTLYALCCGNATAWEIFPRGLFLEGLAAKPFEHAAQFLGQHLFHLQGFAARLHPSGYNDSALDWIAVLLMLAVAAIATPVWTALDRRRTQYTTLFAWLRFLLRLSLATGMLIYGVMKLFPFQIPPPSLAVLNEPVGNLSPLTLLWSTLGFSPLYQRLCGSVEIVAALLLLYRRTALAGALVAVVVLVNILLFDCFFDVPVKLYAANLLLMAFVLIAPDARALLAFFWSHTPAAATSAWIPPVRGRARYAILALELLTLLLGCVFLPLRDHAKFAAQVASLAHPSPLTGQWHLDASLFDQHPHPLLCSDGQPITDIFLEPNGRVTLRAADRTLWPGATYDASHKTIAIMSAARMPQPYTLTQLDPTHLILLPIDPANPELYLTRVPIPTVYPLYNRGFHLTNEWGFER